MPDLEPACPLPGRGDRVLVLVSQGSGVAPRLVAGPALSSWCTVTRVDTGPYDLFPVTVRLPDGKLGAYQQHEILEIRHRPGWRTWSRWFRWPIPG